jgi:Domain of unknown function (DUF4331)
MLRLNLAIPPTKNPNIYSLLGGDLTGYPNGRRPVDDATGHSPQARLRPMRELKRNRTARVMVAGHAFVQNMRRGFYDLGTDVPPSVRLADAFAALALVI